MQSSRQSLWYLCIKSSQPCAHQHLPHCIGKDWLLSHASTPFWAFSGTVIHESSPLWSHGFHWEVIAALVLLITLHPHTICDPVEECLPRPRSREQKASGCLATNCVCAWGGGFWGWVLRQSVCISTPGAGWAGGAGFNGRNALRWWICKQKRISRNTCTAALHDSCGPPFLQCTR